MWLQKSNSIWTRFPFHFSNNAIYLERIKYYIIKTVENGNPVRIEGRMDKSQQIFVDRITNWRWENSPVKAMHSRFQIFSGLLSSFVILIFIVFSTWFLEKIDLKKNKIDFLSTELMCCTVGWFDKFGFLSRFTIFMAFLI